MDWRGGPRTHNWTVPVLNMQTPSRNKNLLWNWRSPKQATGKKGSVLSQRRRGQRREVKGTEDRITKERVLAKWNTKLMAVGSRCWNSWKTVGNCDRWWCNSSGGSSKFLKSRAHFARVVYSLLHNILAPKQKLHILYQFTPLYGITFQRGIFIFFILFCFLLFFSSLFPCFHSIALHCSSNACYSFALLYPNDFTVISVLFSSILECWQCFLAKLIARMLHLLVVCPRIPNSRNHYHSAWSHYRVTFFQVWANQILVLYQSRKQYWLRRNLDSLWRNFTKRPLHTTRVSGASFKDGADYRWYSAHVFPLWLLFRFAHYFIL